MFQSSPGPKAGRCCRDREHHVGVRPVSILARPEGRALLEPPDEGLGVGLVSILARPEGRALRPWRRRRATPATSCFNPRPARRPGAALASPPQRLRLLPVSILARPEGRALHEHPVDDPLVVAAVSILARPEGRALPRNESDDATACSSRFQSSPGPKAGRCISVLWRMITALVSFQSSPGPKAGRCRGRGAGGAHPTDGFNPRPARRPGAARPLGSIPVAAWMFQSSPGPKAGRCLVIVSGDGGETELFQSSPGPKAGRCQDRPVHEQPVQVVSILARPEGRALPGSASPRTTRTNCFNPRPARRPGAAGVALGIRVVLMLVSILARPEGRALRLRLPRRPQPHPSFNPRPARRPGAASRNRPVLAYRASFNPRPARRPGAAWHL